MTHDIDVSLADTMADNAKRLLRVSA